MNSPTNDDIGIIQRLARLLRGRRKPKPQVKRTAGETLVEYARAIGSALLIALVLRQFVFQAFRIPTGSMLETLQIGDFLFVNKFLYGAKTPDRIRLGNHTFVDGLPVLQLPALRQPEQGDIIVFQYPEDLNTDYIKRCVAVAGDRVEVREGVLSVNGEVYESNFGDRDGDHSCVPVWSDPEGCPAPRARKDQTGLSRPPGYNRSYTLATDLERRAPNDPPGFVMMTEAALAAGVGLDEALVRPHLQAIAVSRGLHVDPAYRGHVLAVIEHARAVDAPLVVPEGHLFMMGDNRFNSADSRFWGALDMRLIRGKAMFLYFSVKPEFPWVRFSRIGDIIR